MYERSKLLVNVGWKDAAIKLYQINMQDTPIFFDAKYVGVLSLHDSGVAMLF